jgi:dipeptidyl aminopeptidase/acylaminoacyl peptidase
MMRTLLVSLASTVIPALLTGPSLAATTPFTFADVAATRSVREVAISPDGASIAWVLTVPRTPLEDEDGAAWGELWIKDGDGEARSFIAGQVNVSALQWMPDSSAVVFLAKRGDDKHAAIWSIPRRGGESRRLVKHGAAIKGYSLSPDGARVAFLAEEAPDEKIEALEKKGFSQEIYEEQWRPVRVWTTTLGGGTEPTALPLTGSASELHWSPAGDHLAVALAPTALIDDEYTSRKVHVVTVADGTVVGVVETKGKLGDVRFSPDGEHLALVAASDQHDPAAGRLMVAPKTGGQPRDLLPGYLGHVQDIGWTAPDRVLFVGDRGVESEISEVDLDGNVTPRVELGVGIWAGLSRTQDGTLVTTGEAPSHPQEVFVVATGAAPKRLTDSNPWLAERALARREVVRYTARDGLEIEGLLDLPATGKGPWPLVMVVHGGPEAHVSNGWSSRYANPSHLLTARGYAMFQPNYRASTGRGVEFSKLDYGDPAGPEFDDLVDAISHLAKEGLVDPKKVGITGGSYGGYASAWAATALSEHFAAAVMFVGISDLVSKEGTTDIPRENELVHFGFKPWEKWDLLRERSPIFHVEKARTPILILHGKDDPRVHPSQSLILYRYLKLYGKVPVRLVWYPGEGHGNRRAASQLDYTIRLVEWMDHYLRGPGGAPPDHRLDYEQALWREKPVKE